MVDLPLNSFIIPLTLSITGFATIVPATKFAGVFQDGSNQSLSVWSQNMSDLVQKLEKRIDTKATKLDCWPVGAIYMAIGGSSPASMFGGSWTQIVGKYI